MIVCLIENKRPNVVPHLMLFHGLWSKTISSILRHGELFDIWPFRTAYDGVCFDRCAMGGCREERDFGSHFDNLTLGLPIFVSIVFSVWLVWSRNFAPHFRISRLVQKCSTSWTLIEAQTTRIIFWVTSLNLRGTKPISAGSRWELLNSEFARKSEP